MCLFPFFCLPVEDSCLLEHISQIDVRVQEVWIERDGLLKVVDGQPDLALGIEHTAQVAPRHCKVRAGLDGFEVTSLFISFLFLHLQEKGKSKKKSRKVGREKEEEKRRLVNWPKSPIG